MTFAPRIIIIALKLVSLQSVEILVFSGNFGNSPSLKGFVRILPPVGTKIQKWAMSDSSFDKKLISAPYAYLVCILTKPWFLDTPWSSLRPPRTPRKNFSGTPMWNAEKQKTPFFSPSSAHLMEGVSPKKSVYVWWTMATITQKTQAKLHFLAILSMTMCVVPKLNGGWKNTSNVALIHPRYRGESLSKYEK